MKTLKRLATFLLVLSFLAGWEGDSFPLQTEGVRILLEDERINGFPRFFHADEQEGLILLYMKEEGAQEAVRFDLRGRRVEKLTCLPPIDDTWEFVEDFERIQRAHPGRNWSCRLVDNEGHIYVANMKKGQIEKFNLEARLIGIFGRGRGVDPGQLKAPMALGLDGHRNLYVLDEENLRMSRFDQTGALLDQVEIPGELIIAGTQMKVDPKGTLFLLTPRGKGRHQSQAFVIRFPLKQSER